jgi:hypothetical protein
MLLTCSMALIIQSDNYKFEINEFKNINKNISRTSRPNLNISHVVISMNLFIYLFFFLLSSSLAILDLPFKLFKGVAKCYIASFLPSLAEIISAFEAIAQIVFFTKAIIKNQFTMTFVRSLMIRIYRRFILATVLFIISNISNLILIKLA